ncbi:MAG TPA: peptidylprolyl isomerase, partial [Candidatus Sulfotelmatobacter sp.]|nr:peptidylprolyl isomerase [Candidatus Sulfotelmatobacter sp.]
MVQSLLRAAALSLALAVGLALPASAQAPAAAGDPVVAKVNNEVIHRSEVANVIAGLPDQYRAYPADALFGAVLGQMIDQRLMAEAAEAAKLADDPDVKRRIALAHDSVLQQAYISREVEKGLTEERLKAAYAKRMKEEPPQEEVHARHILVKTEAEAKELIVELQKGADFATLAKSKSTDAASNQDGGDLGYFTKDRMVPEFAEAAFAMKPGEISKTPVQTKFGWHVIKVEDRREGPTFEDAKEELRGEVAKQ